MWIKINLYWFLALPFCIRNATSSPKPFCFLQNLYGTTSFKDRKVLSSLNSLGFISCHPHVQDLSPSAQLSKSLATKSVTVRKNPHSYIMSKNSLLLLLIIIYVSFISQDISHRGICTKSLIATIPDTDLHVDNQRQNILLLNATGNTVHIIFKVKERARKKKCEELWLWRYCNA